MLTCSFLPPRLPTAGRPSTPQVTLTPTAGGLTVQLTVMYPGTREDTLQYSISTTPSPLRRRQTGQQPLPVTDLTTPTSGSAEVALGPGTYPVTVAVTNQHSSTTSVPQQVTIPGWSNMALCVCLSINFVLALCVQMSALYLKCSCFVFAKDSTCNSLALRSISFSNSPPFPLPPPHPSLSDTPVSGGVETAVIIGVVVAVATVILLLIITVFATVLVCVKHKSASE